jgi:hypothetical protein
MGSLFLGDAEDSCGSRRGGGDVWALYVQALAWHNSTLLVGFRSVGYTLRGGLESGLDSFILVSALEQASILDQGHGVAWKKLGLFTWMH